MQIEQNGETISRRVEIARQPPAEAGGMTVIAGEKTQIPPALAGEKLALAEREKFPQL